MGSPNFIEALIDEIANRKEMKLFPILLPIAYWD